MEDTEKNELDTVFMVIGQAEEQYREVGIAQSGLFG